jgi:hypothetical protein
MCILQLSGSLVCGVVPIRIVHKKRIYVDTARQVSRVDTLRPSIMARISSTLSKMVNSTYTPLA